MRFKKKLITIALATVFAMLTPAPDSLHASQVLVTIDGRQVNFTDQGPTIIDGRTLVPVRGVFEELGFEVDWEQDTQTARLSRSEHVVVLTIGSTNFISNGEIHTLDVPAQIIGGRTMLPIRAVLESVGYSVSWIQATNTVSISAPGRQDTYESRNGFSLSDGIDENGFWKGVAALNYVEIFDYENMEIPNDVHHVSDEHVEFEIQGLISQFPPCVMDRAVIDGDMVNIDFVGSINGVEFEGGSAKGADVIIGSTRFIDDFLEQLIGHMPGDTVNVEVTFPDVYPQNRSLQGEDALFVTTINFITGEGQSKLTDEFVLENLYNFHGWRTVDEMKERIHRKLQRFAIEDFVEYYIMNKVNVSSIPEQLIWYQEQVEIRISEIIASLFDMTFEEYLDMLGYSVDELLKENQRWRLEMARRSLILQAVAEHGGFFVSREDVEDFHEKDFGTRDFSSHEEELGLPYIFQVILHQKVIDHIVENAVLI